MNISGVRPYSGFYQYNSIKLNEVRNAQIAAAEAANDKPKDVAEASSPAISDEELAAARSAQTFTTLDYAKQYNPDEEFELKGIDSDINSLDVQKAVSDLDKDDMLKQYQFFVLSNMEDVGSGALRLDENFML